jgi:hypothetical protein
MVSKAGKFANCCFGPNQEFYYFDKEGNKVLTNFKDYVYKNLGDEIKNIEGINIVEDSYKILLSDIYILNKGNCLESISNCSF